MHSMNNKGFALSGISIVFMIIGILLISMALIQVNNKYNEEKNTLYNTIKEKAVLDNTNSEYVTSTKGISFKEEASETNGRGVYIKSNTENDENPIYYYRGKVENNNVIFADFCWKIVRTTDTGGVKLIYNGKENDGKCSNTKTDSLISMKGFNIKSDDNAYVGYMYGETKSTNYEKTHENKNDSNIKKEIDSWYKKNIEEKGYSNKIEDTVWCNDRTVTFDDSGFGDTYTFYNSGSKIILKEEEKISLECPNKRDSFTTNEKNGNGNLTYPVALLTIDEAILAGYSLNTGTSEENYLNINENWWLLSAYSYAGGATTQYINSLNKLTSLYNFLEYGVRPSISLKNDTIVTQGDGTELNPYIVK